MSANPILIFDFDGTIADTHHFAVAICNRLAEEFGYRKIQPDEVEPMKDWSIKEVISHLRIPWLKIPAIIARAKAEFFQNIENVSPVAGLQESLRAIHNTGCRLGILSSNGLDSIEHFLQQHDFQIFDFVRSTSKIWGKNIAVQQILRSEQLDKKAVIYVGDEVRDIVAAQKIGIKVAAVSWGYNSYKALAEHKPDFLIDSPDELVPLIPAAV
ncbi:MAG: HAD-IA family hydrolase [Candidatus Omnitrophota bacterium]